MCVPECFIRKDGKGFIVRKGGIDFEVCADPDEFELWVAETPGIYKGSVIYGTGETIMEAVDNALENVRATESTEASVQEGRREA